MEPDCNSMAFTPEEVEKGLHLVLIKYLCDYSTQSGDCWADVRISSDGCCLIVEWTTDRFDKGLGSPHFVLLDPDEEPAKFCFNKEVGELCLMTRAEYEKEDTDNSGC